MRRAFPRTIANLEQKSSSAKAQRVVDFDDWLWARINDVPEALGAPCWLPALWPAESGAVPPIAEQAGEQFDLPDRTVSDAVCRSLLQHITDRNAQRRIQCQQSGNLRLAHEPGLPYFQRSTHDRVMPCGKGLFVANGRNRGGQSTDDAAPMRAEPISPGRWARPGFQPGWRQPAALRRQIRPQPGH